MTEFRLKDYNLADTIAAIATFPSKSALGVIKISGRKSLTIISKIFRPSKTKNIRKAKSFTLHYGWIVEKPKSKSKVRYTTSDILHTKYIDEVLVSIMRKPHSYTREDVVEISSHGGELVLSKILEMVIKEGARLALPGEFTYRALLKGRIDLLQAESILGIVEAKTPNGLSLATSQLRGEGSRKIEKLKGEIKELFVQTESCINFPEEDIGVSFSDLRKKIDKLEEGVNNLLKGSSQGRIIRQGLKCVICGRTNTGKSTLFNRLLGQERVIVSEYPGTTRDVIEETILIRGIPLRIYDTAGILEPQDLVTKKAVDNTAQIFDEADLVILLLDGSGVLNRDDFFLLEKARNKNTILVINKIDLPQRLEIKSISKSEVPLSKGIKISALKNIGLEDLEKAIYNNVYKGKLDRENVIFLNQYQRQILEKVSAGIRQIKAFLKEGQPLDFINLSLKDCLENLGRLTGEVFSEEILESIFSQFCIGK